MTREDCIKLLNDKYDKTGVYPKKSDFSEEQVKMIKAFFGPWPRALEASGIIPDKSEEREKLRQEKRIRNKKRRTSYKLQHQNKEI